jgi:hypothetical protein
LPQKHALITRKVFLGNLQWFFGFQEAMILAAKTDKMTF